MRTVVLAAAVLGAVACATAGSGAGGAADGPDAAGLRLYRRHCGACHRLRDPAERTGDAWAAAVEKYGRRAHLDERDRPALVQYLRAHAADAAPQGTGSGTR
jgi:mono/diheme cytochrome c family protein